VLEHIIDHHVHTQFSPDSKAKMEGLIDRAKTLGLKGVMFTDHVDFDSPEIPFREITDYHKYGEIIAELQEKNKDIEILTGVEIGYQSHLPERLRSFLASYPFDFVICSLHSYDGLDFYSGDFFIGKEQHEAYDEYFQIVKKSVENYHDFDVYGHLDHIYRCGNYPKKVLHYADYKEVIDEILKILIQNGKGIELNTSGLRRGLAMFPGIDILRRYKNLGGEIITIGSDAHRNQDLHANFQDAVDLLRDLGFKAIAQFRQRRPVFLDI